MIDWGAQKLHEAVESLGEAIDGQKREESDRLFRAVISKAREWQESGYARRLKQEYKNEHAEVSTELTFGS